MQQTRQTIPDLFQYTLLIVFPLLLVCRPSSVPSALQAPAVNESVAAAMAPFLEYRNAVLEDWMPDGRGIVFRTRKGEIEQIFSMASPGSVQQQLTFGADGAIEVAVCPDPTRHLLFFGRDSGGNEEFQLYALKVDTVAPRQITFGSGQNEGVVWSGSGDHFAYCSTRRNGKDYDIYLCPTDTPGACRLLVATGGMWSPIAFSPDNSKLLVSRYSSRTASFLYTVDLRTGSVESIQDTTEEVSIECADWGPDGRSLFYTSDRGTDLRVLRYRDIETKKETLLTTRLRYDIREFIFSQDRKQLAFTTNEHGFSRVWLMDVATFSYQEIPGPPLGVIYRLRFNPTTTELAFTVNGPCAPEEIYSIELKTNALKSWAAADAGSIDTAGLIRPTVFTYPTFDSVGDTNRVIPCFSFLPPGKGPFPVLILLHGGPESQYWPYYTPWLQYVATRLNIAVLAPNVRGSGGYGKAWLEADNGFKRLGAVHDVGALLDWITGQSVFDSNRVAVMGGSYGGYLALASMAEYNTRICAGIDMYGISDFLTFLQNTAGYRRDLRRVEYGDERDSSMAAFLKRISPLTNVKKIKQPLLIIQGANDPRVPLSESLQIGKAVRNNGGKVWMIVESEEGHGFRKKASRDRSDATVVMFLKKFLRQTQ
jgi:dipeptidyl aminopeptidase/acylaminoacyl peptidase